MFGVTSCAAMKPLMGAETCKARQQPSWSVTFLLIVNDRGVFV